MPLLYSTPQSQPCLRSPPEAAHSELEDDAYCSPYTTIFKVFAFASRNTIKICIRNAEPLALH